MSRISEDFQVTVLPQHTKVGADFGVLWYNCYLKFCSEASVML